MGRSGGVLHPPTQIHSLRLTLQAGGMEVDGLHAPVLSFLPKGFPHGLDFPVLEEKKKKKGTHFIKIIYSVL